MRRKLILLHLLFAGFMAPAFLLLSVSGGLYLVGVKGQTVSTPLALPPGASLDFQATDLDAEVRAFLARAGIDHDFEYVRDRGDTLDLRPTSRAYLSIARTEEGLRATRHEPDLQKAMIELHKGHGPRLFKLYQKAVAVALLAVVLGGVLVGLLAPVWRRTTLFSLAAGTLVFALLALL